MEPGASQTRAGGPPQEETETCQPEILTGARPQTEESSEERDIRDREIGTRGAESRQLSTGRGVARKQKPSQDRQLVKLSIKPSERREDEVKDKPGSGAMELIKKMGERAKSAMRTSPPPERA